MKTKKKPQRMRAFGWKRDRWRCDFCDYRIDECRAKLTHKSGMIFYACLRCGLRLLEGRSTSGSAAWS
jgi:DNA-directed RNA polymerase subunit RPC12/RpoP